LNHPVIDALTQLEWAAAQQFWNSEDRSVWKDDLLRQCETRAILALKKFMANNFTEDKSNRTAVPVFPALMWDTDLRQCFTRQPAETIQLQNSNHFQLALDTLSESEPGSLIGMMLRPGFWMTDSWPAEEEQLRSALKTARANETLVFRTGFLTHQADILLAADLGFTGIQIHAAQLDLYELQMALELARDCKLCPLVSVSNPAEMEQVVQTDAPHIALCHFPTDGQELSMRFVQQALPKIPNSCSRLLITASCTESDLQLLGRLGFQAIIHLGE
jgi:hypothetical protein